MNKWIIFIIVVIGVSVIGVGANLVKNSVLSYNDTLSYEVGITDGETAVQQGANLAIRFTNTSEYTISQGLLVFHDRNFSMNFLGTRAPEAYEQFAEIGDTEETIAFLQESIGVNEIFGLAEMGSRATQEIGIPISSIIKEGVEYGDALVSYIARIEETNDGMVWLNGYSLFDVANNQAQQEEIVTEIIDMGFEQNAPIDSGFSGGQTDSARGDENIDNGTTTKDPVEHHPQFYEDDEVPNEIMQINITIR